MGIYRTKPDESTRLPGGIPYIIGNELAERFSFYGMKAILVVYMTQHLMSSAGEPDFMSDEKAKTTYHLFTAAAYFFPVIGSLIADIFLGKYLTIMTLSLAYCVGHGCLALGDTGAGTGILEPRMWLFVGLIFIAVGAGGIKPCVSAHVGDQFGSGNKHMLTTIFHWFYFSINVGATASTLLTPLLLEHYGPWAAFGLPGVLMAIATFVFWLGRNKFVHIPAVGWTQFKDETLSADGLRSVFNLSPIFLIFVPVFWAIFDQTGSAWVLQAQDMDRNFMGIEWLESQIQAANPFLILTMIPLFAYVIYPFCDNYLFKATPLRKIAIGLFVTASSAVLSAWIQMRIDAGETPNIGWQLIAYVLLTAGEVMVSITTLEFAYTQAPKKMKSFIMGIYFLGVSLGNLFVAGVNKMIEIPEQLGANGEVIQEATSKLEGASYFWFFTAIIAATAILFVPYAMFLYKGRTYIQGEDDEDLIEAQAESEGVRDI